jgi:hypothetical protein
MNATHSLLTTGPFVQLAAEPIGTILDQRGTTRLECLPLGQSVAIRNNGSRRNFAQLASEGYVSDPAGASNSVARRPRHPDAGRSRVDLSI